MSAGRAKHTPGPWLAECRCGDWLVVSEFDTYAIAYPNPPRGAEIEANARLIAAAPEILEALIGLRERFGSSIHESGDALDRADAAIAKAVFLAE